ncbi:MAG TPA: (E)-4-hydroxy-3-methylbut-2-enyl-diphosphate synthase [Bacteroidales bacterium]|nr:(E)-4-hydroxy-3-methylbut-2-enyl-diphosphate synthase [Bacteroidales bacterium]
MRFIKPYISSVVNIGGVPLGGSNPIRIQSMTNTDTINTRASVEQCIRIIEAGADFVRLTAQGVREAENLAVIKEELRKAGFMTPLIADIHFNPSAAETAARIVEKVRINPGNYNDPRASFKTIELSDKQYNEELERVHQRLLPLINICREHSTAIRIGINHGSLSDRIMTRYGNTPEGMVRSALEFIEVFRQENFDKLVLSMKSSDTTVMVKATRMLVEAMQETGVAYPLHLGVTEAGEGEDGRVRSAAGIGALLQDGIGDTIRVSLSEDPEKEIPVAQKLVSFFSREISRNKPSQVISYLADNTHPATLSKINGPLVIADIRLCQVNAETWKDTGFKTAENGGLIKTDQSPDIILVNNLPAITVPDTLLAVPYEAWLGAGNVSNIVPVFRPELFAETEYLSDTVNIIKTGPGFNPVHFKKADPSNTLVIFTFDAATQPYEPLRLMEVLSNYRFNLKIILNPVFSVRENENLVIRSSALAGKYIIDNSISGLMISNTCEMNPGRLAGISFSILQSTEKRITRTIYLSCPTCGRTKFNLTETVRKVKEATQHLKGLRIAIMGCIVNGPGEMAGADYGYVGAGPGKVHIYKGAEPVVKNVSEERAIEELLRVINQLPLA